MSHSANYSSHRVLQGCVCVCFVMPRCGRYIWPLCLRRSVNLSKHNQNEVRSSDEHLGQSPPSREVGGSERKTGKNLSLWAPLWSHPIPSPFAEVWNEKLTPQAHWKRLCGLTLVLINWFCILKMDSESCSYRLLSQEQGHRKRNHNDAESFTLLIFFSFLSPPGPAPWLHFVNTAAMEAPGSNPFTSSN